MSDHIYLDQKSISSILGIPHKKIDVSDVESFLRETSYGPGITFKGSSWMNKNGEYVRVFPEEQKYYLDNGWEYGGHPATDWHKKNASRVHKNKKVSKETRKKQSLAHKGKTNVTRDMKYINLTGVVKRVKMEELDNYLNKGWNLGRGPHSWSTRPKGQ